MLQSLSLKWRLRATLLTDRVQAVSNAQQRRGGELGLDGTLDLRVRLNVDTASCLVLKMCSCELGG